MPECDIAVHATILIEEKFKRNYDETEPVAGANSEKTQEQLEEELALKKKILDEEFTNIERQNVYRDLLYINKYTQNCPVTSQMKLLIPDRISFKGPDPPPQGWELPEPPILTQAESAATA